MRQTRLLMALFVAAVVMLGTVAVIPTAAHESETIDGYELTFGGADEPVITGERMWLVLRISDEDGEPLPDQADALQWRVEKPGEEDPVVLDVSEKHGEPGVYEAAVVFTEPGEYVVHIEGTVEDTEVHTHYEKEVNDRTALEYPESHDDEAAAVTGFGPDFGIGIALGLVGAIVAFFIGRRITPSPTQGPASGTAK